MELPALIRPLLYLLVCAFLSIIPVRESLAGQATDNTTTSHGFALYGDLEYPQGFNHFAFVNPDAPKGGTLRLMGFGTFDTLNPYTLKGTSPFNTPGQFMYGFSELNETLLAGTGSYSPSGDEPQSAYGLLAESLTYPDDLSWVTYTLRDNARFHDGHAVDAQDVVFSYQTLIAKGHPRFQQSLHGVASVSAPNPRQVKVVFKQAGQGANILRFGEMPVLPEHFWREREFTREPEIPPLLSGPYAVEKVDMGKSIRLVRQPDFWGKDLNIYRGRYNFDVVTIDYYRDQTVAFEAFKANRFDLYYDYTAKNWAQAYDFPALESGRVIKAEINHDIPSGTQGFFFNTRRALFSDKRVREALGLMFDFEWTNKALFNGAYTRSTSLYPNSEFSSTGLPEPDELALLEPFRKQLPAQLFTDPFTLPKSDGNGRLRDRRARAMALLKTAGWELQEGQLVHAKNQQPFKFEILIRQAGLKRIILPYVKNLERLGIQAELRLLDATQYKTRLDQFDFDMMTYVLSQGQAPSYEQRDYFHSSSASVEGSQNFSGISMPAVDAMIEHVLKAENRDALRTAMRALDRILLWHHFIVPNWHLDYHRLAYWDRFGRPRIQPPYTLGVENWWQNSPTD